MKCINLTYLRIVSWHHFTSLHRTGTSPYSRTLTLTEIGRSNSNSYTVITRQTINNSKSEHLIIVEIIAFSYRWCITPSHGTFSCTWISYSVTLIGTYWHNLHSTKSSKYRHVSNYDKTIMSAYAKTIRSACTSRSNASTETNSGEQNVLSIYFFAIESQTVPPLNVPNQIRRSLCHDSSIIWDFRYHNWPKGSTQEKQSKCTRNTVD